MRFKYPQKLEYDFATAVFLIPSNSMELRIGEEEVIGPPGLKRKQLALAILEEKSYFGRPSRRYFPFIVHDSVHAISFNFITT